MGIVAFDIKKMNKEQLKQAVTSLAAGVLPGFSGIGAGAINVVVNTVVTGINAEIDHWLAQVTIMANPVTAQDVATYLGTFAAVPAESKAFLEKHPEVLRKLTARDRHGNPVFSTVEQAKILANIDWLTLLETVLPIVLKILMMFLV